MTRPTILTIILMMATTLSAQNYYQRHYDYECEAEELLSSFPSDTLLSDACHVVLWAMPPRYHGGSDSLETYLRRTLPAPPSNENRQLSLMLGIDSSGKVKDLQCLNTTDRHLWYDWKDSLMAAMTAMPRWIPMCTLPDSTRWYHRAFFLLKYSHEKGITVKHPTFFSVYPPLDPAKMGYYDAPAVRLPNPTDREKHSLRGAVRSVTDTISHHVQMTRLGPIRYDYYVQQLVFDTAGRQVEDFFYNEGDTLPFRHGLHAYDNYGFPTLNCLIDEQGDTMFVCRWRNYHDAVGNLLLSVMTDGDSADTTWYRHQFTADSAWCKTYEKNQLAFHDVYTLTPQGLRLTLARSHPANGRLTTTQEYTYGEHLERYRKFGLYCSEVGEHRYTYNEQGDVIREEFWCLNGKRMEMAVTYSYRYDAHGNWIERIETRPDNGKTRYTWTKRTIEYY